MTGLLDVLADPCTKDFGVLDGQVQAAGRWVFFVGDRFGELFRLDLMSQFDFVVLRGLLFFLLMLFAGAAVARALHRGQCRTDLRYLRYAVDFAHD